MRGLLNPDNPIMNLITKIAYSAYLNLLKRVTVIPAIIAITASPIIGNFCPKIDDGIAISSI